MAKLDKFLKDEYLPHTRPDIGISSIPDGDKFYEQVGTEAVFLVVCDSSMNELWAT